ATLCLPEHLRIALVTKDTLDRSASDWAQGGIAAAIAPDDSPQLHVEDTLKAGAGLCEYAAVQHLASYAADCVRSLVHLGVAFDRKGETLALTLEAAHSRRRVLHAADTTGHAIITTLMQQVLARPNLDIFSDAFALDLWLEDAPMRCRGIKLLWHQKIFWLSSQAVILATGGGGQVFSQTTNPEVSTGDGVAMAWRAGAILRDLEFIQFHPTALTKRGAPRFLISEAVRGEGAHLVDRQGRRFALDYHPAGELAPRDVVSRAIFSFLEQDSSSTDEVSEPPEQVWLDLRPIDDETIRHRFPNIIQVCKQWGVDVFRESIPVAPAAHYWMGGICVGLQSQSSIPGMYAVGETASTGVHGANRLASNSLLECLVFGAQLRDIPVRSDSQQNLDPLASTASTHSLSIDAAQTSSAVNPLAIALEAAATDEVQHTLTEIRQLLPALVWRSAGICRTHEGLIEAIDQIEAWQQAIAQLSLTQILEQLSADQPCPVKSHQANEIVQQWGEVRNLLDIAWLILSSADFRTESRGGHYRVDFPTTDLDWQAHTLVKGQKIWRSALVSPDVSINSRP
ncbi:MAG: L-aspartate oxidase, partial [Elainellaceae cyanobacterium]